MPANSMKTPTNSRSLWLLANASLLSLLALLALPVLNVALRFLLRSYRGASELFPTPIGHPKLVLMDIATALLFAVCLIIAAGMTFEGDFEVLPVPLIWAYLLIAVRAAIYERVKR